MKHCEFDYASPSSHMFNMFFFYGYSIFMYQVKYNERVNWKLVYSLYFILIVVVGIVALALFTFGILFMYQAFVSFIYSIGFTILCINFDHQITNFTEELGFIIESSRKLKFSLLFWCLGSLMIGALFYFVAMSRWSEQQ